MLAMDNRSVFYQRLTCGADGVADAVFATAKNPRVAPLHQHTACGVLGKVPNEEQKGQGLLIQLY